MNEMMFVAQAALLAAAAFLLFVKKDRQASFRLFLIHLKVSVIWAAFSGFLAAEPAAFSAYIISVCAAAFIFSGARGGLSGGKAREFVLFCGAMILLLLFASGCSSSDHTRYPAISGEIKLDYAPSALAAGDKNELYAGGEKTNIIRIYDTETKKVISSMGAGYMPVDIKICGKKLFSANRLSDSVTVHDIEKGTGVNVNSGGVYPSAVLYNQAKKELYAANMGSNNVAIIDLSSPTINVKALIPTGKWPSDLFLAPDNRYIYVCCKYTNTVQVLDTERQLPVFTKIDTGISPSQLLPIGEKHIAIINEWEYAYNHMSSIIVFNYATYALEYDILVDGGISRAVLSKSRNYMYISVPMKDKVIVVDIKKRQKAFEINFNNDQPSDLAISKDGKTVYAAARQSKKIYMISVNDLR
jgi:DNA-binding beta-propeller fold protein YncE